MPLIKLESPSAERNKEPIWNVLRDKVFPKLTESSSWHICEVAGGNGAHTAHFVTNLAESNQSRFLWQSTDPEQSALDSQLSYIEEMPTEIQKYVSKTPLPLTLSKDGIEEPQTQAAIQPLSLDLIVNINMIHISQWSATEGLMRMANEKLKSGGILYLYGPYKQNGTAVDSNLKFELWLKSKNPDFGLRNIEDVTALGKSEGLQLLDIIEMPANNLSVILRKI